MDSIGVFTPEQARLLWQDYQTRQQLNPVVSKNYPQRRQNDEVSPHRVFVSNESGETIPAYGCLQITGTTVVAGRTALTVNKPSDTSSEYVFNSQFEIESGGTGWAYRYGIVVMLGTAPTSAGQSYSPQLGSWEIESDDNGPFVVFGEHNAASNGLIGRFAGGGASGTVNLLHGIVVSSLGCGYYEIELSEWSGETPDAPSVSDSSLPNECDICDELIQGSGAACSEDATLPQFEETETSETPHIVRRQTTGTGVIVLAFHRASRFVPLQLWSDCLLADLGDENATVTSEDDCQSSGNTEPVYQIVDGIMEHLIQYKERWECCDGVDTLVGRTPIIFPGIECPEETCNAC